MSDARHDYLCDPQDRVEPEIVAIEARLEALLSPLPSLRVLKEKNDEIEMLIAEPSREILHNAGRWVTIGAALAAASVVLAFLRPSVEPAPNVIDDISGSATPVSTESRLSVSVASFWPVSSAEVVLKPGWDTPLEPTPFEFEALAADADTLTTALPVDSRGRAEVSRFVVDAGNYTACAHVVTETGETPPPKCRRFETRGAKTGVGVVFYPDVDTRIDAYALDDVDNPASSGVTIVADVTYERDVMAAGLRPRSQSAVKFGTQIRTGDESLMAPTIIEDVPPGTYVACILSYDATEQACREITVTEDPRSRVVVFHD